MLSVLSILNLALTLLLVRRLSGRRLAIEMASLTVPGAYLAALLFIDRVVGLLTAWTAN